MKNPIVEPVLLREEADNNVVILSLNRPQTLNAINRDVLSALWEELGRLEDEARVRALILTGKGKGFAAGADIRLLEEMDSQQALAFSQWGQSILNRLAKLSKPTIAAINGYALGAGLELALCCDIRLAAEGAKLGLPEINLAIIPGWGGTQRLPKCVGEARAKELVFTGKPVSAEEAERIGLINQVLPPESLLSRALELANEMAAKSPFVLAQVKTCLNASLDLPIESGAQLEKNVFSLCFSSLEQKEAVKAYLSRKKTS